MKWTRLTGVDNYVEGETIKELRHKFKLKNFKKAMKEADAISDEELEAAADFYDRLIKKEV